MFASAQDVIDSEVLAGRLETEMAEVCGLLNATTARLVTLISEVLATGSWTGVGIRSAAQWVAWQCGVSPARARWLVAMAGRLPALPVAAAAFEAGELSEDQTRVICRHAAVHNDAEVTELARSATVSQLSRTLRSYRSGPDPDPVEAPAEEERRVSFGTDDRGWSMTVRAPLDEGALIEQALTAARQDLFNTRNRDRGDVGGDPGDVTWMDALLHLIDQALAAVEVTRPTRDRFTVLLHLNTNTDPDRTPSAHTHGGPNLPDSLRRYRTCDSHIRAVQHVDGIPVSIGRSSRTIPDRTRTLIEERDRGCRIPGCDRTRWLHIHHITHWEDGGPTDTHNLIALCGTHHRLHHQHQLGITGNADQPGGINFTDHLGRQLHPNAPPTPPAVE